MGFQCCRQKILNTQLERGFEFSSTYIGNLFAMPCIMAKIASICFLKLQF